MGTEERTGKATTELADEVVAEPAPEGDRPASRKELVEKAAVEESEAHQADRRKKEVGRARHKLKSLDNSRERGIRAAVEAVKFEADGRVAGLEGELGEAMRALRTAHREKVAVLKVSHFEKLASVGRDHDENLTTLRSEFDTSIEKLKADHQLKIEKVRADSQSLQSKAADEVTAKIDAERARLEDITKG